MSGLWALTASADDVDAAGRQVAALAMREWIGAGRQGVLVSTCHRAELYGLGLSPSLAGARTRLNERAAEHLLRVACGLESVIVGEDEVLHQVRLALRDAGQGRHVDRRLHRLFETAIAAGRQARSGRTTSSGTLAGSAVEWLGQRTRMAGGIVVVAGAGRMGAALAHLIKKAGARVVIASRDVERASRLARVYAGSGVDLRMGAELIPRAAGVAVALGGPWTDVEGIDGAGLPPIADISAPSAIPAALRRRPDRFLGIDDLYRRPGDPPGGYRKDAERLVAVKTAEYMAWLERAA